MEFTGKVVVVTGAGNGIGKAVALHYAAKGAKVAAVDLDQAAVEQTVQEMTGEGLALQADMRQHTQVTNFMKQAFDHFGQIDILINNAGISAFKNIFELEIEEWDSIINTNLRGTFLASREAAGYMKQSGKGGSIVNIASTRATMSEPDTEAYAATKGGIVALTHALSVSLQDEYITVNSISPGWIETKEYDSLRPIDHDQHLSKRVGTPSDIARACVFLTSTENNFINGENLVVDGGMTRKMIYEH
ncbi:SDR family oxidoreductase [Terribacillus saccharophilus]|uniref:SDR family oxidoreductase n=1 Tax=Terribacillus saccharophilus TaxID=361277 RepID=UPI002989B161|nr:SDR family oxidoreductase [Terribacillus saccharophilus]MCM3226703.1 SDR family oxidoreductase [Terribacillus saccharophilus]